MTRAEIRRQQREAAKSGKTYNLNVQQIEEIKKKTMSDLISRQAAIDALDEICDRGRETHEGRTDRC